MGQHRLSKDTEERLKEDFVKYSGYAKHHEPGRFQHYTFVSGITFDAAINILLDKIEKEGD